MVNPLSAAPILPEGYVNPDMTRAFWL